MKRKLFVTIILAALAVITTFNYGSTQAAGKDNVTWLVKPRFDEARNFSDGLAVVYFNNAWGYINKLGKVVIDPYFGEAGNFNEDLACVRKNYKAGYIDKYEKDVITYQFDNLDTSGFSEGLAAVKINGKWGYIKNPLETGK